ncbi:uncharacterized protein [Lepeophtheirus salmonis]|uniref:uncharacterized protein n=1 Tax=Lepeophtheirus salmonis TaxID=72036 RepID=UPI003AF37DB6
MSWCSEDVWTMLMSRLLSEEEEEEENARSGGGVGVEVLLSKVLLEMDNVFSEGKKLLSECLESDFKSAQCRGEPLSIPQNLLRVYDLKEEAYWVKEGISLEELKSYFPKAIVNSTPHSFKEEQNSSHATHLSREEEEEGMELGEEDDEEEEEEDEEEEEYDGEIKSGIKDELDEMYEEGDSRDSDGVSPSSSRHSSYYKKRGSRVCQLCNKIFSKDFKNFDVHVTQCELIASYGDVRDGRTCPKCHKKV